MSGGNVLFTWSVEENDHAFAEACAENEVLVLVTLSESHDISFEYCHRYSVHDSFENLLDYGQERLPSGRFSQDN